MDLSVFDLHCDTALEMYRLNCGFYRNNCHISAQLLTRYRHFGQIAAVFCPHELSDEDGYRQCFLVLQHLRTHLDGCAKIITDGSEITTAWQNGIVPLLPSIEDARILAGKSERIQELYCAGVRIITLLWAGETCIGGSHDTSYGLSPFGRDVVRSCFKLGIIPDVSHASEQSTDEIVSLSYQAGVPCIASHSDAFTVHPHSRNLRDRHFDAIRDIGGVVGLNLCPDHLGGTSFERLLSHAEHYLDRGGEHTLCLGCDLDGTDLPNGIKNVSDLVKIADLFASHGYSDELISNIFYGNAVAFLIKNLKN